MQMKIPENINRSDVEEAIHQWVIGQNGARDRVIMSRRIIDGITFESLAEEFEMSDRQIKNVVYKWQDVIFRHIHK